MSGITVSNLCKTYIVNKRQNNVLRNVNLTLEEKEMIAVMGPSGSGKTTLLYTISGMDSATAGSVKFFERELTDMSRNEISDLRLEEMGFVFQQMYMLKNLSVYDITSLSVCKGKNEAGKKRNQCLCRKAHAEAWHQ